MAIAFTVGAEYKRKALHDEYGGSRQGGISPSRRFPVIFLISSPSGQQHGYQYDGFQPDGTYWYTGEGQIGDMEFVRGNRAVRESEPEGRELHLFEESRSGYLRYVGSAQYLGDHLAPAPDRDGKTRRAIVFELALDDREAAGEASTPSLPAPEADREIAAKSLAELRAIALEKTAPGAPRTERRVNVYRRSQAVRLYALRRASGVCEACKQQAPFQTTKDVPYLEPHHTRRVADGGPDHPRWVAAVCPNCHRRIHYGKDGVAYNAQVVEYLGTIEES